MTTIRIFLLCTTLGLTALRAQIPYGNNPAAGHYIILNEVKHYYEVYGNGPALLLIHGNGTATAGWAGQIPFFAKSFTVYSIDCRGRGKSAMGKDSLTYLQQARDMDAFINALHLDSVCVVGKSDGGIIALLMGIYFPQHLKKIVAFSANVTPDTTALYPVTVLDIHDNRVLAEKMLKAGDTTKNWAMEYQRYRLMEFQPHISGAELQRIQIPVLVMSCDRDVIREAHTFFIYSHIPNANLCIVPNRRHALAKQDPEQFNRIVDEYLKTPFRPLAFRFE